MAIERNEKMEGIYQQGLIHLKRMNLQLNDRNIVDFLENSTRKQIRLHIQYGLCALLFGLVCLIFIPEITLYVGPFIIACAVVYIAAMLKKKKQGSYSISRFKEDQASGLFN